MGLGSSVWKREATSLSGGMSRRLYSLSISGFIALGIAATMIASTFSRGWTVSWPLAIGVLVVGFAGIFIALRSDRPPISLLGYGMVAIPFGLLLGPVMALHPVADVVAILLTTIVVTIALGLVGALMPWDITGWASWLFGGLIVLLAGMFIIPLAGTFGLPVTAAHTFWDWAGMLLFSAYIVFDWNRAMRLERTLDNSIDVALAVYLDWLNLFTRGLDLS
jgi:FtsH-binding integral membrane protein